MKKIIFSFLILFSLTAVQAQKVQMGLKFSPHLGWVKSDNKDIIENKSVKVGFSYGLIIDYNILENIGLSIEPTHTLYNTNSTGKYLDTTVSPTYMNSKLMWKFQYIEIPISLKMRTKQIKKMTYFGKIGIAALIKTSAKINDEKANKNVNIFNFKMQVGGGVHYSLGGNTALLLGLTFHNGFVRFNKDDTLIEQSKISKDADVMGMKDVSLDKTSLKPSYISLDIGILF
jgi:hypothetical protein